MKANRIVFTLVITLIFGFSIQAETVDSKIEKVTVYRNGAFVTRTASIEIPAGNGSFVIYGMADRINEKTARIKPNGDFEILSIRHKNDYLTAPEESDEIKSLKAEKEKLEDALKEHQLDKQVLEEELALLNGDKLISKENKNLSTQQMTELMDFYRDRLKQIRRSLLEANESILAGKDEVKLLQRQITQFNGARKKVSQFIVETYATRAFKSSAELSYWTQNASWKSMYDIRVKDIDEPLSIQSNATLINSTGEDWNDIQLSLSTGNPWRSMVIPTLNPWWINFQKSHLGLSMQEDKKLESQSLNFRSQNRSIDDVPNIATAPELPKTEVSENMTTMEFKISGSRTIPSNNLPNTIKLETNQIKANFHYEAIPSKSDFAFLKASIKEWQNFNFSYGEAALYFEGTYIGKTMMDPNQVRDSLSISFGPDIAVAVTRKKSQDFEEKKWFGTKRSETDGFEFEIKNNKSAGIDIRVVDRMPVSANESIEVELLESGGAQVNEDDGILTWNLSIDSGESASDSFTYRLTYPKGEVVALN